MINRRDFILKMAIGTTGSVASYPFTGNTAPPVQSLSSQVSFVTGTDRRSMAHDALIPFIDVIRNGIQGKQIIIKPNVVEPNCPLAVTNIDTIRGVLDFLKNLTDKKIIIGEAACTPSPQGGRLPVNDTLQNFSCYGYDALKEQYNIEFIDFNKSPSTTVNWTTDFNAPGGNVVVPMNIASYYLDKNNYFLSLANLKTHSIAICTLSIKNFCMSSPPNTLVTIPDTLPIDYVTKWIYSEKNKIHLGSYKGLNYNIARVARHIKPGFCLLDGVVGMEGDGPAIGGKPVNHGVMVASPDMVSADRIGIELMGLDYNMIKYVQYCSLAGVGQGDIEKITILGPSLEGYRKKYQLPSSFKLTTTPITWIQNEPSEIKEFLTPLEVDDTSIPKEFTVIVSNVPNPFNTSTVIHLSLANGERISLSIYSISGQLIRNLGSMYFREGEHLIPWDGKNDNGQKVSSGVYIVCVNTKNRIVSHRMMLLK